MDKMNEYEQLKKQRDELNRIDNKLMNKYGVYSVAITQKIREINDKMFEILKSEVCGYDQI